MTYFNPTWGYLRALQEALPEAKLSADFKPRLSSAIKRAFDNIRRYSDTDDDKKLDFEILGASDSDYKQLLATTKALGDRSMEMQLSMHLQSLTKGLDAKLNNLRSIPNMLVRQFAGLRKMWVFRKYGNDLDGVPVYQPFIFNGAIYTSAGRDYPASVSVNFSCQPALGKSVSIVEDDRSYRWRDGDYFYEERGNLHFTLHAESLYGKTLRDLFSEWGLELFNEELYERYQADLEHFRALANSQEFPVVSPFDEEKGALKKMPQAIMFPGDFSKIIPKLVSDKSNLPRAYPEDFAGHEDRDDLVEHEVPIMLTARYFCLSRHSTHTTHTARLELYKFRKDLGSSLILPEEHADLINALLDTDSLTFEDFTEGKGNSSVILCGGSPGLGKTLTAEIFAEATEKALFRIPCGLLGTDYATIEKRLGKLMALSAEWGAIMLLDEADLLIRSRSMDFEQNAIVSVMLRLLEFYPGIIFMTTNLLDVVDEAVLSRCIAVIKYVPPHNDEVRTRLWSALWDQFLRDAPAEKLADKEATIAAMIKHFPDASGRSIKELLKLTIRYVSAKDNEQVNEKQLMRFAAFRSM